MPAAPIGDVKPIPAASTSTEQVACEAARGKWVECGNPCHGKPGDVCITSCEPQCLCGGIAGWMCPKDLTCTDYEPEAGVPDALGVCRPPLDVQAPWLPDEAGTARRQPPHSICDDTYSICVDESLKDAFLTSPFVATGTGIAVENTISWSLLDGNGGVLEKGSVMASYSDLDHTENFTIRTFLLDIPKTPTGTLVITGKNAGGNPFINEPIHAVKIPVRLPTATMTTRFYMLPPTVGNDCSILEPVEATVPRSGLPVETSLRALLEMGPIMSSKRTAIPQGTRLESLKVSGGTATVVFSPELQNYGGGSCNVQAIRSQIEQTLKQFSSVKNVVISVVGKTAAETLQP